MSTYFWIEAELDFGTVDNLEESIKELRSGGWLNDDNTMVSESDCFVNDGKPVINGAVLKIPADSYRNLGRVSDALINRANSGFFNLSCSDGDFLWETWHNGIILEGYGDNDMIRFLSDQSEIDVLSMEHEDFIKKYNINDDEAFDYRYSAFNSSFTNAIECFHDEKVAMKYIKDKMFVKAIHARN